MTLLHFPSGLRVFVDPGHGGNNRGCLVGEMHEKEWTLAQGIDLTAALRSSAVEAMVSRSGDVGVAYSERAITAKAFGADLALLLHVDSLVTSPGSHGLVTYCWSGFDRALRIGRQIMLAAPAELNISSGTPCVQPGHPRWTRGAETVLRPYAARGIDAVLIEHGFSTNALDLEILLSEKHRPGLILAALCGVARLAELA